MVQLHDAVRSEAFEESFGVGELLRSGNANDSPVELDQQDHRLGVELEEGDATGTSGVHHLPELGAAVTLADLLGDLSEGVVRHLVLATKGLAPGNHSGPMPVGEVLLEDSQVLRLLGLEKDPLREVGDRRGVASIASVELSHSLADFVEVGEGLLPGDEERVLLQANFAQEWLRDLHHYNNLHILLPEKIRLRGVVVVSDIHHFELVDDLVETSPEQGGIHKDHADAGQIQQMPVPVLALGRSEADKGLLLRSSPRLHAWIDCELALLGCSGVVPFSSLRPALADLGCVSMGLPGAHGRQQRGLSARGLLEENVEVVLDLADLVCLAAAVPTSGILHEVAIGEEPPRERLAEVLCALRVHGTLFSSFLVLLHGECEGLDEILQDLELTLVRCAVATKGHGGVDETEGVIDRVHSPGGRGP
mmetsp:Transcript_45396/g.97318  ORF Transcript_45396/g.97318 Transcript_45396/m.97318 type:complete len:421 (-) Transcript_45396:2089-3351(-)